MLALDDGGWVPVIGMVPEPDQAFPVSELDVSELGIFTPSRSAKLPRLHDHFRSGGLIKIDRPHGLFPRHRTMRRLPPRPNRTNNREGGRNQERFTLSRRSGANVLANHNLRDLHSLMQSKGRGVLFERSDAPRTPSPLGQGAHLTVRLN